MKNLIIIIFLFLIIDLKGQAPFIIWQRSLGGYNDDYGSSIIKTMDGNLAVIGSAFSNTQSPDILVQHASGLNSPDFWFLKFANDGTVLFNTCYGGGFDEIGSSIVQTNNGRFLLLDSADSNDQFVTGVHGAWSIAGLYDYWLIKLDSLNNVEWQHCYGTTEVDHGFIIKPSMDNGFILTGEIEGYDGDVTNFQGNIDIWVVKIDSLGNIQWQKPLGGYSFEQATCLLPTEDRGFLVGGTRGVMSGNITCSDAQKELWIVKLDSLGNIEWDKCFGGSGSDQIKCLLPSSNNGFYAAGSSSSNDGDITSPIAMTDGWIFKADSLGDIIWDKSFGGTDWDEFSSMAFTSDHAIVCSGGTKSPEFNFHGGNSDAYVVKMDTLGNLIWQSCYGGSNDDYSNSIVEASDSSLFFIGYSTSNDGDLNLNRGGEDMWVVKLASPTQSINENLEKPISNLSVCISADRIKIDFYSVGEKNMSFRIFDLLGREIKKIEFITHHGENHFEPSFNFGNGIYIIRAEFANSAVCKKIVISR